MYCPICGTKVKRPSNFNEEKPEQIVIMRCTHCHHEWTVKVKDLLWAEEFIIEVDEETMDEIYNGALTSNSSSYMPYPMSLSGPIR